jgi:hypothetical protein
LLIVDIVCTCFVILFCIIFGLGGNVQADILNLRHGVIVGNVLTKHIRGAKIFLADTVSRNPADFCERDTRKHSKDKVTVVAAINLSIKMTVRGSLKDFSKYQARDKRIHETIQIVNQSQETQLKF